MSGLFRPAYRVLQRVQVPGGVLSVGDAGGSAIQPAHVASTGAVFQPLSHRTMSVVPLAGVPAFGAITVQVTLKPISVDGSSVCFDAAV